jgi:hypothetical protein
MAEKSHEQKLEGRSFDVLAVSVNDKIEAVWKERRR